MGELIDLGPVEFRMPSTQPRPAQLHGGPFDGRWTMVPPAAPEAWELEPPSARVRFWHRYTRQPNGQLVYTGAENGGTMTRREMDEALRRHQLAGQTFGESYGA